jgi:hypothetical protein
VCGGVNFRVNSLSCLEMYPHTHAVFILHVGIDQHGCTFSDILIFCDQEYIFKCIVVCNRVWGHTQLSYIDLYVGSYLSTCINCMHSLYIYIYIYVYIYICVYSFVIMQLCAFCTENALIISVAIVTILVATGLYPIAIGLI